MGNPENKMTNCSLKLYFTFFVMFSVRGEYGEPCDICDYTKPTIEVLEFQVQGDKVESWIEIDDEVWTTFLSQQPGYVSKGAYYPQDCDQNKKDPCLVSTVIYWETLELWK